MVERDEFEHWMQVLRDDIRGVHTRLDNLNGRTRANETEIAVIKASGGGSGPSRDTAARWGAVGAGVAGLLGYFWQLFK